MRAEWIDALLGLVPSSRLASPTDVPRIILEHARRLGAVDANVYLVDLDQRLLVPLPHPEGKPREPLGIDGTLAGRAYRFLDVLDPGGADVERIWLPMLDGIERIGVMGLDFEPGEVPDRETLDLFTALVTDLIITKSNYGDLFATVRRRRPMSLAAELAWQLLPPLTFGTDTVLVTGVLTPAYDVGGDSFDYAVDGHVARFAIFDAMGHGLEAGLVATVAVAAYRHSRRHGLGLEATIAAVDLAIADHFYPERFATAVVGELDIATGRVRWALAGHPPPLLLRHGRVVKALTADIGAPLGLGKLPAVAEEALEPGDQILLFSDGVIEARSAEGEFFGVDRLADLITRESAAGNPPPETMRRLVQAILGHQAGELQDDATTVLVEWRGGSAEEVVPD